MVITLDRLPYEVIIYILQLHQLDVNCVLTFAQAFPRYEDLSMHVLECYQLPRLYLQSSMDQEGKKKYLTQFKYHSLDIANHCVTFMAQPGLPSTSKRYISNSGTAARPQLRQITLHHHDHGTEAEDGRRHLKRQEQRQHRRLSFSSVRSYSSAHSGCLPSLSSDFSVSENSELSLVSFGDNPRHSFFSDNKNQTTGTKPMAQQKDKSINLIQSRSLSLKQGIHTIFTASSKYHYRKIKQSKPPIVKTDWQYSYHVGYSNDPAESSPWFAYSPEGLTHAAQTIPKQSCKTQQYMHLSPISITVSLYTLCPSSFASSALLSTSSPSPLSPLNSLSLIRSKPSIWFKKCLHIKERKQSC